MMLTRSLPRRARVGALMLMALSLAEVRAEPAAAGLLADPFPVQLFADDFSDPGSGWGVGETSHERVEYLAGEYHIQVKHSDWTTYSWHGPRVDEFAVEVDIRSPAAKDYRSFGLIVGMVPPYLFTAVLIRPTDGRFAVLRYNEFGSDQPIGWTATSTIRRNGEVNKLRVERQGRVLSVLINGQAVLHGPNLLLFEGLTGVAAFNWLGDSSIDAYFDNFRLYGPPGSIPPPSRTPVATVTSTVTLPAPTATPSATMPPATATDLPTAEPPETPTAPPTPGPTTSPPRRVFLPWTRNPGPG